MADRAPGFFGRLFAFLRRAPRPGRPVPPPVLQPHARKAIKPPLQLVDAETWAEGGKFQLDPHLRVAFSLLKVGDPALVFARTGMRLPPKSAVVPASLSLPVQVGIQRSLTNADVAELASRGLTIPPAYHHRGDALTSVTGHIAVSLRGSVDVESLQKSLRDIIAVPYITDLRLPTPLLPCDAGRPGETLQAFGIHADRKITIGGVQHVADGRGTVIGIIDDGCAFAHGNFRRDDGTSRVLHIWDQGRTQAASYWKPVQGYGYGYELANLPGSGSCPLDDALAANTKNGVLDEDNAYAQVHFPPSATIEGRPFIPATHGTHVMDVAAGNGRALFGGVGVAPAAEIIFVQLPPDLVAAGGAVLAKCVEDGADYICARVDALAAARGTRVPVSINISFGGYAGSHDGMTSIEKHLDQLLAQPDRAIAIAAGNGFDAGCHAQGRLRQGQDKSLRWLVPAFDESMNVMEIWYTGPADLALYVTPPGNPEFGPVLAGQRKNIVAGAQPVGYVDHVADGGKERRNLITVSLHPTWDGIEPPNPLGTPGASELAPAGTWLVRLARTSSGTANRFHAWIERDEMRKRTTTRRVQSRFHDDDADPRSTVTGLATGLHTIAVGGYDVATREVAEYSACGPTRPYPGAPVPRRKPEICAPAAFDASGRGVSSAAARSALRSRMAGTSIAAPHVAGLAALAMQLNRDAGKQPLAADVLRQMLQDAAVPRTSLRPNRHQDVDPDQPIKQRSQRVWRHVTGAGAVAAWSTLKKL
jgi:subtilisin family serine protease